ncbi:pre-60S factor rei1 [Entomophthora muscae]|uniref:Pre-60S factor rei1 n=1 Tax=Entomophthora muscae TaxID=34485 RepID=A0ACC2RZK2_9FUNG|nr:pre-60S factor rei1 [Entomophthora muscae]
MSFISAPQAPQSQLFTCLTCQVAFHTAERQRTHYRTEWHRYNLKRKVAELSPITADAFANKVLAQKNQQEQALATEVSSLACLPCRKNFASENSYNNHLQSKKHRESATKYDATKKDEIRKSIPAPVVNDLAEQEDEDLDEEQRILKLVDKKIACAVRLEETDCLFCTKQFDDFDSNLKHMTESHDFYIPDVEFLTDLRGLVKYLGEKISIANVCLYCNGKGRELKSLDAVRNHMARKGHCKIAYDDDIDIMEISDFYDFTTTYGDAANVEGDDLPTSQAGGVRLGDNEFELILPTGLRIGHRSLARYYKQNVRPIDEQEARSLNRLVEYYAKSRTSEYESRGRRLTLTQYGEQKLAKKQIFKESQLGDQYRTRVGFNANRLQRHFREQIL